MTDENQGGENRNRKPPDWIPDNSIDGDEDLPWTRTVPVLAKPHPLDGILGIGGVEHLPGAEGNSAVADGKGEIGTEKAGLMEKFCSKSIRHKSTGDHHLGMSRHVVGAFARVLERNLLRDEPGQNMGRVFVQMLQRIKFAQLLAQQQQSGRLGSLPSVKYNAAAQREDTHTGEGQPYTA